MTHAMGWPGVALASALAWAALEGGPQSAATTGAGVVTIRVVADDTAGVARVVQQYQLPPDTASLQLQLLQRSCVRVGAVMLVRGSDSVSLARGTHGPWATYRDTSVAVRPVGADSSRFEVHYTVTWQGAAVDVPLIHPLKQVPRLQGEREGGVLVSVVTRGDVRFPRLSRTSPGAPWTGRFVAIPSFVQVTRPSAATTAPPCEDAGPSDQPDGGLTWRFWTLLGIMIAWVPLYLGWARRAQDGGEG